MLSLPCGTFENHNKRGVARPEIDVAHLKKPVARSNFAVARFKNAVAR